jgi:membrane-associated phospholipid phosphatase
MMYFGMVGMTLFLFISWIYPNGLDLRPEILPRDNVFTDLVRWIYSNDTATNVLPSIHVFNSVGVCCAIHYSDSLRRYPVIQKGSTILTVLIVLSTMFIKQHSVVDVVSGLALSYLMWELVYNRGVERLSAALEVYQESARRAGYRKKRVPRWQSK